MTGGKERRGKLLPVVKKLPLSCFQIDKTVLETREVPYGAINIDHKLLQLRQSQCADETTERKRK